MKADFLEPLLSADDAKRADQYTIRTLGISGTELMERAGLCIAQGVESLLAQRNASSKVPVVILCGPGNNGGDGWVAARRLWQNGVRVAVLSVVDVGVLRNEAQIAAKQFLAAAQNELWTLPSLDPCAQTFAQASRFLEVFEQLNPSIIVDALFGTGLKKPAEGLIADVIKTLNDYKIKRGDTLHILAADIPSGLYSDGQATNGVHVRADSTLAIQFRKVTHLSGPHWRSCGQVSCADIGIQLENPPAAWALLANNQPPLSLLRPPMPHYHKGHYGHVGVLLGSEGIKGASELCAYSSLRAGAGLVSLLVPQGIGGGATISEIMHQEITSPLGEATLERLSAFVIGPGINENRVDVAKEIMTWALAHKRHVVVDAGALSVLALVKFLKENTLVATPHPGEAARLLATSASDIESDRLKSAHKLLNLSQRWRADFTWVLKGACPIIAHRDHGLIVLEGGISTLSIGGSGDVLAGTIGALFAQSNPGFESALLGAATHLQAGRNLLSRQSRGFLAHEIADEIASILFARK
jgi:hydroxyethylthiazole kinase-like uncharacterized protein yjeF